MNTEEKKDLIIKDNELKAEIFETLKAHKESANSIKRYVDLIFYVTILSIAISAIVIFSMYEKKAVRYCFPTTARLYRMV